SPWAFAGSAPADSNRKNARSANGTCRQGPGGRGRFVPTNSADVSSPPTPRSRAMKPSSRLPAVLLEVRDQPGGVLRPRVLGELLDDGPQGVERFGRVLQRDETPARLEVPQGLPLGVGVGEGRLEEVLDRLLV